MSNVQKKRTVASQGFYARFVLSFHFLFDSNAFVREHPRGERYLFCVTRFRRCGGYASRQKNPRSSAKAIAKYGSKAPKKNRCFPEPRFRREPVVLRLSRASGTQNGSLQGRRTMQAYVPPSKRGQIPSLSIHRTHLELRKSRRGSERTEEKDASQRIAPGIQLVLFHRERTPSLLHEE